MTIEEMKGRKRELGYSNEQLSELTGVPAPTLQKIFSGTTKNPRRDTILALEAVLAPAVTPTGYTAAIPSTSRDTLQENSISYSSSPKKQGEYTLDDYYAWPEDQRIELIDGVIYDMNAPMPVHQLIAGEVYRQISGFIQAFRKTTAAAFRLSLRSMCSWTGTRKPWSSPM